MVKDIFFWIQQKKRTTKNIKRNILSCPERRDYAQTFHPAHTRRTKYKAKPGIQMWHTKSVRHFSDCSLQSRAGERLGRYRTAFSRSPGKIWNWNQQKRSIQFPLYAWFNWKSRPPFLCLSISLTSQAVLFLRRYAKWSVHSTTGCHNGCWWLLFDYRERRKRERKRFFFCGVVWVILRSEFLGGCQKKGKK